MAVSPITPAQITVTIPTVPDPVMTAINTALATWSTTEVANGKQIQTPTNSSDVINRVCAVYASVGWRSSALLGSNGNYVITFFYGT